MTKILTMTLYFPLLRIHKAMHNLIANLFKKGKSPCIQEFPEIRIKRQILDHHIKGDCNTKYHSNSRNIIFAIEVLPAQPNRKR